MLSTPPATISCSQPERTFWAATLTDSRPEAQNRSSCRPAAVVDSPAVSAAVREITPPWSPTGETTPRMTSSTRVGSRSGLRSSRVVSRSVTRVIGLTPYSAPPFLPRPRGVRTVS